MSEREFIPCIELEKLTQATQESLTGETCLTYLLKTEEEGGIVYPPGQG